jgi:hypothetical protein
MTNTAAPTAIYLRASNYNRDNETFEALGVNVFFETYEAAQAFVAALPKTAQRRVFSYPYANIDGLFTVNSDARTYQPSALTNFRRFVKAAIATGAPIVYHIVPEDQRGAWGRYPEESDIREAFGL